MILINRKQIETLERERLAPYAALAADSRGRKYRQEEDDLRTAFQRDRDRIIHSTAFRRLDFKTQVFLPHEGDHFRTRLTHTIEVAQIARTMARNLMLNEDLAEAIALAHDLGHTPFGHSGEDVLNELLHDRGGFNHNRQSLRVVDILEQRSDHQPGLNLSYEVREGIAKHETKAKIVHPDFDMSERPTLEASLVDIADEIAYNAHDIDDGLRSGLIHQDDLADLAIYKVVITGGRNRADFSKSLSEDQRRHALARGLLNFQVRDVMDETERQIARLKISDRASVQSAIDSICRYSPQTKTGVVALKRFLMENLYHHPRLATKAGRVREIIELLFARFSDEPSRMPLRFQQMLRTEEPSVVIADYIAGMTDRYAEQIFSELD